MVGSSAGDSPRASLSSGSTPATLPAANANGCSPFEVLLFVAPRASKESAVRDERSERRASGIEPGKWTGGRGGKSPDQGGGEKAW